jgi:hypothetical protein
MIFLASKTSNTLNFVPFFGLDEKLHNSFSDLSVEKILAQKRKLL